MGARWHRGIRVPGGTRHIRARRYRDVEVDTAEIQEDFDKKKAIVLEKGQHKDWQ